VAAYLLYRGRRDIAFTVLAPFMIVVTVLAVFALRDWDWKTAEEEDRKAVALNPGYPTAHLSYSNMLRYLGRTEESIAEARRDRTELENAPQVFGEKRSALMTEVQTAETARRACADRLQESETALSEADRDARAALEAASAAREDLDVLLVMHPACALVVPEVSSLPFACLNDTANPPTSSRIARSPRPINSSIAVEAVVEARDDMLASCARRLLLSTRSHLLRPMTSALPSFSTRSASVFACCAAGPLASPSPEVWVRICVIVRLAGLPEGVFKLANSGRYLATGSATLSLPSSCNMRIAVPVIGFVIEAIQTTVSSVIT
jgi:hypothetical protein